MRTIPDPGFTGDDGSVPAGVAEALGGYDAGGTDHRPALAVLQHARMLVPVVAVAGEVEYDEAGRPREKTSDMAVVLITGQDGRRALLAFTGQEPMRRWDPAARPVPVTFADAARAARQEGADAVVVDVAGPVLFVVEGDDLGSLAQGDRLARLGEQWAWVRPADPQG